MQTCVYHVHMSFIPRSKAGVLTHHKPAEDRESRGAESRVELPRSQRRAQHREAERPGERGEEHGNRGCVRFVRRDVHA